MPQKVIAVYPGSFDPPTLGHLDIIERAAPLFDELVVLVAENTRKKTLFTLAERKALLEQCLKSLKNVSVDTHSGLTVDYVRKAGGKVIIRGLRTVSDFENELAMAGMNRKLYHEVETLVIMAGEKYQHIASHTIKEVAAFGADLTELVPAPVIAALKKKLKN